MARKNRLFAKLASDVDTSGNIIQSGLADGVGGAGVTVYASASAFPITNNSVGDQAFASDTNRLYIWNGSGWYSISLINATPTVTRNSDEATLTDSDTTLVFSASDSDGTPIVAWTYLLDSTANGYISSVQNDSNGSFILSYDSNGTYDNGLFTARASDGINIGTKNITILVPGVRAEIANYSALVTAGVATTSGEYTLFKFTNNSYTFQVTSFQNIPDAKVAVIGGGGSGAPRYYGGGGGAGAVVTNYNSSNSLTLDAATYAFSIGAGGAGINATGTVAKGNDGGLTRMLKNGSGFVDAGGGQGGFQGWQNGAQVASADLADYTKGSPSGDGAQNGTANNPGPALGTYYYAAVPTDFTVYRNVGGDRYSTTAGGGGGGAGTAGGNGTSTEGGAGGNGLYMPIFESLEASSGASDGGYFAAGSGGIKYSTHAGAGGLGGAGEGQVGATAPTSANNYGSAGGSAMHTSGGTFASGDGFDGVVMIAVRTQYLVT